MIIKSLSRKLPSFGQLIEYMSDGADEKFIYSRNLYTEDLKNQRRIENEFKKNFSFLKRQKNSNSMYHEILSISKSDLEIDKQKEILFSLLGNYIEARAKNCLVYGRLHEEDNNLHFHLLISSNEIEAKKNYYLSKKEFSEVKKGFEKYVLGKYPELKQKELINNPKKNNRISRKEFELKKRTGKITKRESIQYRLTKIFNASSTREEFINLLRAENIQVYIRGKNIGFIDEADNKKRRYRLNKLGLSEEFNKMSEIIAQSIGVKAEKRRRKKSGNQTREDKSSSSEAGKNKSKEKKEQKTQTEEEKVFTKEELKQKEAQEELRKLREKKIENMKKGKYKNFKFDF